MNEQSLTEARAPSADGRAESERFWLTAAVLVAGVIVARLLGMYIRHVYDDAFITFRYARNLTEGIGFVYNAGEKVLGTTSPLFGLLLAPLSLAGLKLELAVPVLNTLLDCASVLLVLQYCRRRGWLLAGVLFAVMYAGDPHIVRIAVGGMEVNLFLLVSLGAVLLFDSGRPIPAALLAGAAYFIRPEAVLLAAVLLVLSAAGRKWSRALGMALTMAAVIGIPLAVVWWQYGSPVSHSVATKASAMNGSLALVLKEQFALNPIHIAVLPLAVWGVVRFARRDRGLTMVALWTGVYIAVYVAARPFVWGWYFHTIHFAKFVFAGLGLADILTRARRLARIPPLTWAVGGMVLALLSGTAIAVKAGRAPVARHVYEPLVRWFAAHPADGSSVLASDIGVIGYASRARVYDLGGLVTPGHRGLGCAEAVRLWEPEYLFLIASTYELGEFLKVPELSDKYEPVARFSKTNQQDLEPAAGELSPKWLQDYILYRRSVPPRVDSSPPDP